MFKANPSPITLLREVRTSIWRPRHRPLGCFKKLRTAGRVAG
jgi:hypothetical protein